MESYDISNVRKNQFFSRLYIHVYTHGLHQYAEICDATCLCFVVSPTGRKLP